MQTNFNINLDKNHSQFVNSELQKGKFKNTSEIFEMALDLLKIQGEYASRLKDEIQAGIDSGIDENFDEETFLIDLKTDKKSNA